VTYQWYYSGYDVWKLRILLPACEGQKDKKDKKHTTGGIPRWSPTLVLVARFSAYVWQSGRDHEVSIVFITPGTKILEKKVL
jgi:hypothetical protein